MICCSAARKEGEQDRMRLARYDSAMRKNGMGSRRKEELRVKDEMEKREEICFFFLFRSTGPSRVTAL